MQNVLVFSMLLWSIVLQSCQPKEAMQQPKRVAIVVSTLNNPWFVVLAEAAAAKAEALGYETKIFDSQNNTALEADHFENAITSGYQAILFNCTDADGSIVNVRKAEAAGVGVICMDREINSSNTATCQILSDSYSGCVSIGKYFVQKLNKEGKYVELLGLVGDNNTWSRSKGFHAVVDRYPKMEMVAQQSADFDRNKAMEVLESILQAHPDIDAVFCGNDAMAMGAYQALYAAGKAGQVQVFGFDGSADAVAYVKEGKLAATSMQYPTLMAETAASYADQLIRGESDFPQKVPVSVELVRTDNAVNYMDQNQK